jgi:hypothetical protein
MSRAGFRDTNLCLAPEPESAGALLRIFNCGSAVIQRWSIGI